MYLKVGPLTLPQEINFEFNLRDKTPEVFTDYAKIQILSRPGQTVSLLIAIDTYMTRNPYQLDCFVGTVKLTNDITL